MYDGAGHLLKFIPPFMNESLELLALCDICVDAELMIRHTLSYIPSNAPDLRHLWLPFEGQTHVYPEFDVVLAALLQLKDIWDLGLVGAGRHIDAEHSRASPAHRALGCDRQARAKRIGRRYNIARRYLPSSDDFQD
ncbi:hypothetical protein EYR38_002400 [Pleurotus pulmonarius]|nr:hypothetical protein EYR38_002400 [Pleurotus pulmonarius]